MTNGTNLKGADQELKKALIELNHNELTRDVASKEIAWKYIPPASPHMGGAWERLVGTLKTALKHVLKEHVPREEVLQTLID